MDRWSMVIVPNVFEWNVFSECFYLCHFVFNIVFACVLYVSPTLFCQITVLDIAHYFFLKNLGVYLLVYLFNKLALNINLYKHWSSDAKRRTVKRILKGFTVNDNFCRNTSYTEKWYTKQLKHKSRMDCE